MVRLSLIVGAALLLKVRVSGTALPARPSSCRDEDSPALQYLLPGGGGIVGHKPSLNPAQKNESFVLLEVWER